MEDWTLFLQERWFVIIIAIVVIWFSLKVIKTVLKWAIVIGVIVLVVVYGSNYIAEITY